jgi:molybdopterin converting factor small subunit
MRAGAWAESIATMKILFFGPSRPASGCAEMQLDAQDKVSIPEFWDRLIAAFPELAPMRKTARLARHEIYLEADALLQPDDEIAVIPPVSGG